MSRQHYEIKVGAFVLLGLVLLAGLILLFSKGTNFWIPTYNLRLSAGNVGGIKAKAPILLSGVPIGRVASVEIGEEGTNVYAVLSILKKYKVYSDATFSVEQFGFLGDQYISVKPDQNHGKLLQDGDEVQCSVPFNMQEAVGRAADTISGVGVAAANLNQAVTDVRHYVLTPETLTNIALAMDRVSTLADQAIGAVSNINLLVTSNAADISESVSNLHYFTTQLAPLTAHVDGLVSSNEANVTAAINNLYATSSSLTNFMSAVQEQKGTVGRLLLDQEMATNLAVFSRNLASISATLDQQGLWHLLWRHKSIYTNSAAASGAK